MKERIIENDIADAHGEIRGLLFKKTAYPNTIPGADIQVRAYLQTLFNEDDLVEIRPIEILTQCGRKRSRMDLDRRCWITARDCGECFEWLQRMNKERLNVFIGVNPRRYAGGTKSAINICRSVWVDLDHVSFEEAQKRWEGLLPRPSMLVASGHGYHAYWMLRRPFVVRTERQRERFEAMLKSLYRDLGADATSDVSRVLRLPGTWNVKDVRFGKTPEACVIVHCDFERKYPLSTFRRWFDATDEHRRGRSLPHPIDRRPSNLLPGISVDAVVQRLEEDSDDRSRRDFAVVCQLLRCGLDPESIWQLVQDRSKFAERGREYFNITIQNALRNIGE